MLAIHTATQPSQFFFAQLLSVQCLVAEFLIASLLQRLDALDVSDLPWVKRREMIHSLHERHGVWSMLLCLLNFNVDRLCRRHTKCLIGFNYERFPLMCRNDSWEYYLNSSQSQFIAVGEKVLQKQDMWPVAYPSTAMMCHLKYSIYSNPQKDRTCFQFPGWYRLSLPYYQVLFFFYTLLICSIYWSFVDIYWHCICLPAVLGMSDTALVIGSSSSPSDSLSLSSKFTVFHFELPSGNLT